MEKHIVVAGAGQVGFNLVRHLSMESIPVTVIEDNPQTLRYLKRLKGVNIIPGSGQLLEELRAADVGKARIFFAALTHDAQNIVASYLAKQINQKILTVARIRNRNLNTAKTLYDEQVLPVDIPFNPEAEIARHIVKLYTFKHTRQLDHLLDGEMVLRGMRVVPGGKIANRTLIDLKKDGNLPFIVAAITRKNKTIIPRGETILRGEDTIHFFMRESKQEMILSHFDYPLNKLRHTVVIGGGSHGKAMAEELAGHKKVTCRLIEHDRGKGKTLDSLLDHTIILSGDGTDKDVLRTNQVGKSDLFISMTSDGFTNLISGSMAHELGAKNVYALTFNTSLYDLSYRMGIDACLNPRNQTINRVLSQFYSKQIRSVFTISNEMAEVLEIEITKTLPITDKPLKELTLEEGVLIGSIQRGDRIIIPSGDNEIKIGDKLLVFTLREKTHHILETLFQEQI